MGTEDAHSCLDQKVLEEAVAKSLAENDKSVIENALVQQGLGKKGGTPLYVCNLGSSIIFEPSRLADLAFQIA